MKNKGYGMFRFVDENGEEQFRKPNLIQRKRILVYYLRRRSGRKMTVKGIAEDFHVSERTMQKLLKELETEGIIRRDPVYDDKGVQKANKIVYTGEKKRLTGKEPSIDKICAEGNPMHLRDFEWTGFWQFIDAPQLFFDGIKGCRYEEEPIDEDEFYHGPPLDEEDDEY